MRRSPGVIGGSSSVDESESSEFDSEESDSSVVSWHRGRPRDCWVAMT